MPEGAEFRELVRCIIEEESLSVVFQPICSIRAQTIVGLEALTRGIHPDTGEEVSHGRLLAAAKRIGMVVDLDRACRKTALRAFKPIHEQHDDISLFVNFESAIIDEGVVGSGKVLEMARECEISPGRVVIELIESQVERTEDLVAFVKYYRDAGFFVALDDVGSGHSSLERLSVTKPDVIKIDRSMIRHIDQEYYKQEIFKSLVLLGHNLGAVVLAEGMETEAEVFHAMDYGADLFQGFHLARPASFSVLPLAAVHDSMARLALSFKTHAYAYAEKLKAEQEDYTQIAQEIASLLAKDDAFPGDASLRRLTEHYANIECVFVLDAQGIQTSNTVFSVGKMPTAMCFMFHPTKKGADHSLKDFFIMVNTGLKSYVTETYISLASGRPCKTLSLPFEHERDGTFILCMDFDMEGSRLVR